MFVKVLPDWEDAEDGVIISSDLDCAMPFPVDNGRFVAPLKGTGSLQAEAETCKTFLINFILIL